MTEVLKKGKLYIGKCVPIFKTLSVEPAAFCLMSSALMSYLLLQDLIIERVCKVNLDYETEVCNAIVKANATFPDMEIEVQKIAAQIRTVTSIVIHSLPLIFILFLGPWSDIYGRRVPMMIGAFSYVISHFGLIICSYFESMHGHTVSLIANLLRSIFGANVAFSMAAHSYIADTTDISARTVRTGILSAASTLGVPVGFALGGTLRKFGLGFMTSFAISGFLSLIAFLIVIFAVKDKRKIPVPDELKSKNSDSFELKVPDETDSKKKWFQIFNLRHSLLDVIWIPFKKRVNSDRLYIWLLIITWICVAAPIHGEFGVMYLYLRKRLHWDAGDYGYFSMYNFLIGITGTLLSMGLLKQVLKLSDPLVGFIAGISQFSGCIIYAIATTATLMYLAPTVDLMNGTMVVIARSMISKIVSSDEVGKTFTLIAILETLVPLVMDPVYSTLYRLTVDIFPGYFFLLSAALTVPPQIIYAWLFWDKRYGVNTSYNVQTESADGTSGTVEIDKNDGVLNPAFSTISLD